MKSGQKAAAFALCLLLLPQTGWGDEKSSVLASNSGLGLNDVSYHFDANKLENAKNSFHFLRSFVDYFFLVVQHNENSLPTLQASLGSIGWCVGDAHPENFGFLIQNDGSSLFSMNDMDDSGPCPLAMDLFRLLVSVHLSGSALSTKQVAEAYSAGLQQQGMRLPSSLKTLLAKSQAGGMAPSPHRVNRGQLVRRPEDVEATAQELADLNTLLTSTKGRFSSLARVVDALSTYKVGGGSGGLLRYEVLLSDGNKQLLHLELKEETTPAIYPVATEALPSTADRIAKSLDVDLGPQHSVYYNVVSFAGKEMLVRPRYGGDIGVSLKDQNSSDNDEIILYEAFTLGSLHAKTIQVKEKIPAFVEAMKKDSLKIETKAMADFFKQKFAKLKPPILEEPPQE